MFDFMLLPLEIQDLIVNEIVHNSFPEDRINFAQTSKYSNWLVKRSKPKRIINKFVIDKSYSSLEASIRLTQFSSKLISARNSTEASNVFRNCQINTLQMETLSFFNNLWTPEFEQVFVEASEFLTKLKIYLPIQIEQRFVNYYQKLKHLNTLIINCYISSLLDLPRIPPNLFLFRDSSNDNVENFLQNLALKTKDYPLSSLFVQKTFAVHDIQQFLQKATFFDSAKIMFSINEANVSAFLEMLMSFGKHQIITFAPNCKWHFQEYVEYQFAILLKENIRFIPSDANDNWNGIYVEGYVT